MNFRGCMTIIGCLLLAFMVVLGFRVFFILAWVIARILVWPILIVFVAICLILFLSAMIKSS